MRSILTAAVLAAAAMQATPGNALTVRFLDNLTPGNTLEIEDDSALDTGDPNAYLNRRYNSQIFTAPFSFGGFNFSRFVGQGDGFSWIGDREAKVLDNWRDQIGTLFDLSGRGSITIVISDLMENIASKLKPGRKGYELENVVVHRRSTATSLRFTMQTFRGDSTFDLKESLLYTGENDFGSDRWPWDTVRDQTFFRDFPAADYSKYWLTQIITISGEGSATALSRQFTNISSVPVPASVTMLLIALAGIGACRVRRARKN